MHKVPVPTPHPLKKPNRLPNKFKSLPSHYKSNTKYPCWPARKKKDPAPFPKSPVSKNVFRDIKDMSFKIFFETGDLEARHGLKISAGLSIQAHHLPGYLVSSVIA